MSFTQTKVDSFFTAVESLYDVAYDIAQGALDGAFVALDKGLGYVTDTVNDVVEEFNAQLDERLGLDDDLASDEDTINYLKQYATETVEPFDWSAAAKPAAGVDSEDVSYHDKVETIIRVADTTFGPEGHSWRSARGQGNGFWLSGVNEYYEQAKDGYLRD